MRTGLLIKHSLLGDRKRRVEDEIKQLLALLAECQELPSHRHSKIPVDSISGRAHARLSRYGRMTLETRHTQA